MTERDEIDRSGSAGPRSTAAGRRGDEIDVTVVGGGMAGSEAAMGRPQP